MVMLQDYPIDVFYVFEGNRLVHRLRVSFDILLKITCTLLG